MNRDELGCVVAVVILALALALALVLSMTHDAGAQVVDYGYGQRCCCAVCWWLTGNMADPETWQWHLAWYGQWVSAAEATAYWEMAGQDCWQPSY